MVNFGVASSPFGCIFMQITSDPMRSVKLLFDLKVASGDFPSGSTYLRLLVGYGLSNGNICLMPLEEVRDFGILGQIVEPIGIKNYHYATFCYEELQFGRHSRGNKNQNWL